MTAFQFLISTTFTQESDKVTKTAKTHYNTDYQSALWDCHCQGWRGARFPRDFGKAAASNARPCSTLPAPGGTACGPALSAVPPVAPARRLPRDPYLATHGTQRHGEQPPPLAGERAASGAGVRPRGALPGAGRAAQPGGAGGRQPGGGHVSGGGLGGPTNKSLLGAFSLTCALWRETGGKLPRTQGDVGWAAFRNLLLTCLIASGCHSEEKRTEAAIGTGAHQDPASADKISLSNNRKGSGFLPVLPEVWPRDHLRPMA